MSDNSVLTLEEVALKRVGALERVADLALQVVLETPTKSADAHQSYVRRALIAAIEEALVEAGVDVKLARSRVRDRRVRWTRKHSANNSPVTLVDISGCDKGA